ncbi:MAG TPA: hypothetical protein VIU13_03050, partial [Chryseolinea sp.]
EVSPRYPFVEGIVSEVKSDTTETSDNCADDKAGEIFNGGDASRFAEMKVSIQQCASRTGDEYDSTNPA